MNFNPQFRSRLSLFIGGLLIMILSISFTFAQSGTSGVSGVVKDAQGNVVSGATVRLINDEKGFSRTLVTTDNGVFNFASISPDTYTLEIEAANFKKYVQNNVSALIDKPIDISIALEAGNVSETVTVTGDAVESLVNTTDATVGNNFQPQQIIQLPTDLRNINNLLSLQPGVTREGYVNGGRSDQANITLDGIDVNDQQTGAAFSSVLRITTEAVAEFRVTTLNANANQGRSSGAQISLSTKSGTNDFRGVVFEFYRPTRGSANTFINNRLGRFVATDQEVLVGSAIAGAERAPRPDIARHVFGGALGGPIIKDKFFFFYSYEGQREKSETPVVRTVPLASLGRGELKFINIATRALVTVNQTELATRYAAAGLNPASIAVLASAASRYPANDFKSGFGDNLNTAGFRFNAPTPEDLNTHILRLDYNITQNQSIFFRGNKQQDTFTRPQYLPDSVSPENWNHNTGFALGHNWTIGSNKVNVFRYGFTRQAFTLGGDANENAVTFRDVFQPKAFSYTLSRITPIQNFTNDFTWTKGNHSIQFGGNVRIIRNNRIDTGVGYDNAVVNPSFYTSSGRSVLAPLASLGVNTSDSFVQAAMAALIGRFSQYSSTYNYNTDGSLLATGTPIERKFATEEYDIYGQDSWKIAQNFTVNFGLRYALSRPVYEKNGYQVRPGIPLGEYFNSRVAGAEAGRPYNQTLQFELAGPKNNKPGFYSLDTNNFQPRVSAAWSPNFQKGFLGALFGKEQESTFRGGFSIVNDYFGQQLAVTFDGLSTLGFTTSDNIAANTFNVTSRLAPRFQNFGQRINNLPFMSAPDRFNTPADEDQRIESSLDSTLVSPTHYSWSVTYGRKLPKGLYVEASYIGRKARKLLATRDIMALNNLKDPASGTDWYTAGGKIYDLYFANANPATITPIPYFENLFPGLGTAITAYGLDPQPNSTAAVLALAQQFAGSDWTFLQLLIDDDPAAKTVEARRWSNLFYQPQYAAFSAFSTVGKSDYHGGTLSVRQRLGTDLTFDFNYTFAKSMDDSSGLQTSGTYGAAFILNPLRQQDNYAVSDFDVRHSINANAIWQVPIGKGRRFFSDLNSVADVFLGGWQLGGIYRWNTGLPISAPADLDGWATNWNVRSSVVRTRPIQSSVTRGGNGQNANLFSDLKQLSLSLRPPRPGETGDRNVFRESGYSVLDMNLAKTFKMPWNENHNLQFRWEVFNVFNYQYLTGIDRFRFNFNADNPDLQVVAPSGEYNDIQGAPRRMQFGLRYSF